MPLEAQEIPEAEKVDMADSPVSKEEMDAAMEALKENPSPLEMPPELKEGAIENIISPEDQQKSDVERMGEVRDELEEMAAVEKLKNFAMGGGDGGGGGGNKHEWQIKYKECDVCLGSGKRFFFFNCGKCKGTGRLVDSMKASTRPVGSAE